MYENEDRLLHATILPPMPRGREVLAESGRPCQWQANAGERGTGPPESQVMCRQAYVQRQALELYTHLIRVPPSLVVTAP
ncbi:hypothetical protein GCM10009646_32660 [Streptomyces aureus]